MFMVASSVVTTIMILNLHHRLPDTHTMPFWVSYYYLILENHTLCLPGPVSFSELDTADFKNVSARTFPQHEDTINGEKPEGNTNIF